MQCGCRVCGHITTHVEKGTDSYCVCSECGWQCRMCMGGKNPQFHYVDREEVCRMKEEAKNDD